jgi:hypothetical protein
MRGLIQQLRDACANATALARLVMQTTDADELEELKESAQHVEQECLDAIRKVDSAQDN